MSVRYPPMTTLHHCFPLTRARSAHETESLALNLVFELLLGRREKSRGKGERGQGAKRIPAATLDGSVSNQDHNFQSRHPGRLSASRSTLDRLEVFTRVVRLANESHGRESTAPLCRDWERWAPLLASPHRPVSDLPDRGVTLTECLVRRHDVPASAPKFDSDAEPVYVPRKTEIKMHQILTVPRKVKDPSDRSISDNKYRTVVSDTHRGFDLVPWCRQLLIDKRAFFARTGLETPCTNIKLRNPEDDRAIASFDCRTDILQRGR